MQIMHIGNIQSINRLQIYEIRKKVMYPISVIKTPLRGSYFYAVCRFSFKEIELARKLEKKSCMSR